MDNHNTEVLANACKHKLDCMDPLRGIKEGADRYVPLYCYTATSSYALGLTKLERQEVVRSLRKLFDYFYELTIEKTGKYHVEWEEYTMHSVSHESSAQQHRINAANFTEGNTFVCIGSPEGNYFNDKEKGSEFGEITYVIYGMYNFLKNNTDYDKSLNNEIRIASDLYESIINNPNNRRVYLKMKLKKTDIAYTSDTINDRNRANEETLNIKIRTIYDLIPILGSNSNGALICSTMLKDGFQFAHPLGNCNFELCDGVKEIKDIVFERKMAIEYIKMKSILEKTIK